MMLLISTRMLLLKAEPTPNDTSDFRMNAFAEGRIHCNDASDSWALSSARMLLLKAGSTANDASYIHITGHKKCILGTAWVTSYS